MRETLCSQVEIRQFLSKYQSAFTRREDGSRCPKWEQTWNHAKEYFQGLLRPGKSKSAADIADHTNAEVVSLFLCKSAGAIEKATAFCQVVRERNHSQPRQNCDGYF